MKGRSNSPVTQPLIIDLHLDLAWDSLFWNRDLTLPVFEVRNQEDMEPPQGRHRASLLYWKLEWD